LLFTVRRRISLPVGIVASPHRIDKLPGFGGHVPKPVLRGDQPIWLSSAERALAASFQVL